MSPATKQLLCCCTLHWAMEQKGWNVSLLTCHTSARMPLACLCPRFNSSLITLECIHISRCFGLFCSFVQWVKKLTNVLVFQHTHQAGVHRLLFLLCCFNRHGDTHTPPLSSPPLHPHQSLLMCRRHRAGISNASITTSKNLLLSYGPPSCSMLYRAGRCLPQTESSLHIFFI